MEGADMPVLLEACADSVVSAQAAAKGGAQRVELCSVLDAGGITPSAGLIAMARKQVTIALHVLIRPRAGDFCYSPDEFEVIKRDIVLAKQLGANGVVIGLLDPDGHVDEARTSELVTLARPLSVTFHRAFDAAPDLPAALEEVIHASADRILTSGGAHTAEEGARMIARLVKAAAGRVAIMACGRIREGNVRGILEATGVSEVHANLYSPVPSLMRVRDPRSAGAGGHQRAEVLPETVAKFLEAASKARLAPDPGT
jgi:copper homeostasis protein